MAIVRASSWKKRRKKNVLNAALFVKCFQTAFLTFYITLAPSRQSCWKTFCASGPTPSFVLSTSWTSYRNVQDFSSLMAGEEEERDRLPCMMGYDLWNGLGTLFIAPLSKSEIKLNGHKGSTVFTCPGTRKAWFKTSHKEIFRYLHKTYICNTSFFFPSILSFDSSAWCCVRRLSGPGA